MSSVTRKANCWKSHPVKVLYFDLCDSGILPADTQLARKFIPELSRLKPLFAGGALTSCCLFFFRFVAILSAQTIIFVCNFTCNGNRDSSVGIALGYWLDDRGVGVRVPVGSRIFSSYRREKVKIRSKVVVLKEVFFRRYAVAQLVEALCYKLEGRQFKSRIKWIFSILPIALWPWGRLSL
jgi:hypothetical protein